MADLFVDCSEYLKRQALSAINEAGGEAVLFFSDLAFGPNSGWNGSATQGAAVTVWGKNLGASRGSNYITINGASLTDDANYAEWGAIGPSRGLERITFWIPSTATTGAGTITVTVDGTTSNSLPFEVASASIFFIDVANGSNTNNGQFSTNQGGSNGPWQDVYMFNPSRNGAGDTQYIVYVRGGSYSTLDVDDAFVALRGPYGSATHQKALVGYPTETPTLNCLTADRGVKWDATYDPYGRNNYFTCAKLRVYQGFGAFGVWGDYCRVVGNQMVDMREDVWAGVVMVDNSQYTSVYGNLFSNCGHDSYKHNVYIKTHLDHVSGDKSVDYTYVGWNEFDSPYAEDTHGGTIFVSREGGTTGKYTGHTYIHDNYFHDGNTEFIYIGDGTAIADVYVYKNVLQGGNSTNGGMTLYNGTTNAYFYNNVFYQMGASDVFMMWGTGSAQAVFKNNIWMSHPSQTFLYWENYQGATWDSDHDLFYDADGSTTPPSGAGITVTDPVVANPLFVDADGDDFALQSGSPGRGAGLNLYSTLSAFEWGTKDYDGFPLESEGAWDLGAIQYREGS